VDSVAAAADNGYLLLYYPMEKFSTLMGQKDIDGSAFLALVDEEGYVLGLSDAGAGALQEENLLDAISGSDATAIRTISNRMKNGARGSTDVTISGKSYLLVYMPVGTNDWEMFLGVSRVYADTQIALQWKDTKKVLLSVLAVIFVFICLVVVINIISKMRGKEKEKQLENKADTDLLTGLNNKLATERKIKEYMAHNPNTQSMLFILDIDNFKKINDTMGHAFGDEVLRSLGQQIGVIFRTSDIIGRVGGDEFMIFLKGITDDSVVRKEARKVEAFFKNFQAGEYVKYAATASIGVAIYPQEGNDFETLYKAADQGLYKAKKRGKNQLAFYRDEWAQEKSEAKAE
jgi:diguanylate cyclase (GGDEF)-like protein